MYACTLIISHNKSFNKHHHSSSSHSLKTEEENNEKFTSPNKYAVRVYDLKKFDDLPVHQSTKILNSSPISQVFNPSKNPSDYGLHFYKSGFYEYNTLKNVLLIDIKSSCIYSYFKTTRKHSWPYSGGLGSNFPRNAFIYFFTFVSNTDVFLYKVVSKNKMFFKKIV